jgi:cell wall-associated NlpC family hydrolase
MFRTVHESRIFCFLLSSIVVFALSCKSGKKTSSAKKKSVDNTEKTAKQASLLNTKDIALKKKYAEILGTNEKDINNLKLYYFIDEWMGVPYKYGGNDKNGIDCSGFTGMLYREVYNKNVSGPTSTLIDLTSIINESELKEGDMVFFHIEKKGKVSHVGVYLQNNKFVHATTKKGVMINDLNENYYKQHYFKSGRVK